MKPHLIGLPEGECLDIDATNAKYPVVTIDASPGDYLTKTAGATPFSTTGLWKDFLAELTGGDTELEDGLQMWFGLAMLPGNPHHKAHILFGDGNTGKVPFSRLSRQRWAIMREVLEHRFSPARRIHTLPNCYRSLISGW